MAKAMDRKAQHKGGRKDKGACGTSLVEYVLLVALIAIVCIGGIRQMTKGGIKRSFCKAYVAQETGSAAFTEGAGINVNFNPATGACKTNPQAFPAFW